MILNAIALRPEPQSQCDFKSRHYVASLIASVAALARTTLQICADRRDLHPDPRPVAAPGTFDERGATRCHAPRRPRFTGD